MRKLRDVPDKLLRLLLKNFQRYTQSKLKHDRNTVTKSLAMLTPLYL